MHYLNTIKHSRLSTPLTHSVQSEAGNQQFQNGDTRRGVLQSPCSVHLLLSCRLFPVHATEIGNQEVIDIVRECLAENLVFFPQSVFTAVMRE